MELTRYFDSIKFNLLQNIYDNNFDFFENIKLAIDDTTSFFGIDTVERLLLEYIKKNNQELNNSVEQFINIIDEEALLKEYKQLYLKNGIRLRTNRKYSIKLVTLNGEISFKRYYLVPKTTEDSEKLKNLEGTSIVVPKDQLFRLSNLPTKLTVGAMLLTARTSIEVPSYNKASIRLKNDHNINICSATAMHVTDIIGDIVFKNEMKNANDIYNNFSNLYKEFTNTKDGVLYIETDGAMFNTRKTDKDGSSWAENKLGMVFSTDDLKYYINHHTGERECRLKDRIYTSYIGHYSEFKKLLLMCALKKGYGKFNKTVVISDGAKWIKSITDEVFWDAIHILDFYHLKSKIYSFARIHFNNNEKKYTNWADEVCGLFRYNETEKAIKKIEKYQNVVLKKKDGFDLVSYINSNLDRIKYDDYRKQGYLIGSGAIEGSNKSVLIARLRQSGMRWTKESAQGVVTLKSIKESNLWNSNVVHVVRKYYGLNIF
jgi:hypothetical protein